MATAVARTGGGACTPSCVARVARSTTSTWSAASASPVRTCGIVAAAARARWASKARAWPDLVGLATFSRARPISCGAQTAKQIATGEGVLHLASVLDCFSRRIVGWQMGPVADAELVAGALEMAVGRRRPGTGSCTTPTAERRAVHRAGPRADVSRPRRMSPGTPQPLLGRRHTGDGGPTGGAAPWWAPSSSRPFGGHGLT